MRSISKIPGALVVWIISYLIFLSSLVNNLSASHDSIHYLLDILNGRETFHQHHLLYNFLAGRWRLIFSSIPPHYAIESFTAVWGSSALSMVYLMFRNRFHLYPLAAAAGTAIIGFSYGVWFYSVNIEVYMPPLFFILSALYFLTKEKLSNNDIIKIALLHSMAILFHEVNILFSVVVVYGIVANRKHLDFSRAVLQYCVIGIVVAGGAYFITGWFFEGHNSFPEWIHWVQGYTVGHGYWQPLSLKTPLHVATGFSHAFFGGHFIFKVPAIQHALQQSLNGHGLADEMFIAANISAPMAWVLCILTVIVVTAMVVLVLRFFRNYTVIDKSFGNVVRPVLLTIVVYSVFFCFWMPEILEFWILQMVLVWLLLIGTIPLMSFPFRIHLSRGLIIIAVLVFCINYFGSLRWMQDIRNDWYYNEVSKIKDQVSANDLVIIDNEWILKDFVRYYTNAQVLATDEPAFTNEQQEKLKRQTLSRNGKVFIYKDGRFTRSY